MKSGFNCLDRIICGDAPQLILLSGTLFTEELSGDIANNVSLKQGYNVLEIVRCKKEYLMQRIIINEANVEYKKWNTENEYSDEDLKKIGQATLNNIRISKKYPTIIEQELDLYDLKKVEKIISDFAKRNAERKDINALVVLDIFPLSFKSKEMRYRKESLKFIKALRNICNELCCNIVFIDNIDLTKKYDGENHNYNYLVKDDIDNIQEINEYVDKFIITNIDKKDEYGNVLFNIDVYNQVDKIGECKLNYNNYCRKFEE